MDIKVTCGSVLRCSSFPYSRGLKARNRRAASFPNIPTPLHNNFCSDTRRVIWVNRSA